MKKVFISLLCLLLLVSCKEERKITVNQIDTGYKNETLVTIENGYYPDFCMDADKDKMCILRMTLDGEKIGYDSYDFVSKEHKELGIDEIPTSEKFPYGGIYATTDDFSVHVKYESNYEEQKTKELIYVNKDGNYTFLYEATSSMNGSIDYDHAYIYENNNKVYLVFDDENDLVINEITSNNYIETDRKPLKNDDYELVDFYFDEDLILIYESNENKKVIINDEEYVLDIDEDYLIFNEILLVSKSKKESSGHRTVLKTYVVDRKSKEIIELEEKIDCYFWWPCDEFYYDIKDDTGYLTLLTYKEDALNIITTSYNQYSLDNFSTCVIDNKLITISMDYSTKQTTYDLIILE